MSRIEELVIERGELVLTVWNDDTPAVFDADSDDALVYLTPILGACQVIALHHIARTLRGCDVMVLNIAGFAAALGLTPANTFNSKIVKVFGRLERFGYLRAVGTRVEVRTHIPSLPRHQVAQMPEYLRATAPSI